MGESKAFDGGDLFERERPVVLSEEEERVKRAIYEKMNPRRRKFIDKIGYAVWNPFQEPKEPLDLRRDRTKRTVADLLREFKQAAGAGEKSPEWLQGATECAMGLIKKDEKFRGVFDFCAWYRRLLEEEEKNEGKI